MIDSNNNFKKLSKGLIESVRSIMEAKEGTHPKTEKEKDLAAKAPPHDKITHADVLAGRGVLKKHPVHGKMVAKEEVEQIDEISAELATRAGDAADERLRVLRKQRKFGSNPSSVETKSSNQVRKFDQYAAKKQNTMEEAEQIDEISKDLARSYFNKALDSGVRAAARQWRPGSASDANAAAAVAKKRAKGLGMAKSRLAKEEAEQIDEAMNAADRFQQHHQTAKDLLKSISQHLGAHADAAKNAKDYKGKKGPNWGHVGTMEHVAQQLGGIHDMLARQGEYAMNESVELDEAPVDGVAPGSMANDGHLCATKVFHKEWAEGTPLFSQHAEPDADGNIAWYDVMFEHGIEKMVPTDEMEILMAETHERHGKRKMREEIDEARGRPPKEGSAAWKARQAAAKSGNVEGDEPRQHIIQQLQRAKLSMQGGAKIRFKNGEEHHVHGTHAAKLLDKYAGMKPHEKETFQKKIGASHEGLKSEL